MDKNRKHIVFDLDGTIIDSRNEILETYQEVFNKYKPRTSVDVQDLNYGATIHGILNFVYNDDVSMVEKAKKYFSSIYDSSEFAQTNLYNGVIKTLNLLKGEKYKLYVATNKRYIPTLRILRKKNISDYFSEVIANEMQPGIIVPKHQMLTILMEKHSFTDGFFIGDTLSDMEAGKKQNLQTIAASYGYGNMDIFTPENSNYIINSFEDIVEILKLRKS